MARHGPALSAGVWFTAAGVLAVLAAIALARVIARSRLFTALLALSVVSFGAGVFQLRTAPPGEPWRSLTGEQTTIIEVDGVLLDTPRARQAVRHPLQPWSAGQTWSAQLRVRALRADAGDAAAQGLLTIRGEGAPPVSLRAGDMVRIVGRYRSVAPPENPGEPDRLALAAQEFRVGSIHVHDAGGMARLAPESSLDHLRAWALRARDGVHARARAILVGDAESDPEGAEHRALLAALILGEESPALTELRDAMTHLGIVHVLSISGFHLAVLVFVALLALRVPGDLGRWEPLLVAMVLAGYLAILPYSAPVWRSGLMVLALLVSEAMGRRYDRLAVLGWIAFLLLLYRPMDAWSLGFQLSFGLVAVLVRFGPSFHDRLWGVPLRGVRVESRFILLDPLKRLISANVLCWIASTPVIVYHTGLLSPLAPLAGVVLVPLVSALLIAAYLSLAIGIVVPVLASVATPVLDGLARLVSFSIHLADGVPGAWALLPRISLALCIVATLAALACAAGRLRRGGLAIAAATFVLWGSAEVALGPRLDRDILLRVDMLSVGDGTCHLVRAGRDAVLWDAGSLRGPQIGRRTIPRALRELGAWHVPTAIVTHPNLDHFNALIEAAPSIGLRQVITTDFFLQRAADRPYGPEAWFIGALRRHGIEIAIARAGDRRRLGELELVFINPPAEPPATFQADNDFSLVGVVEREGEALALFTGDVQQPAIELMQESYVDLTARVMEAPHHGSAKPAAIDWIRQVAPEVVLQSTGPQRAGDPRLDPARAGRAWLCTATNGAAWAEIRRDGKVIWGTMR